MGKDNARNAKLVSIPYSEAVKYQFALVSVRHNFVNSANGSVYMINAVSLFSCLFVCLFVGLVATFLWHKQQKAWEM